MRKKTRIRRKTRLKGGIGKPFVLALLFITLLLGTAFAIVALKTKQDQRISAVAATKLSFAPASSETAPLQKNPSDTITVDIMLDPGTNAVSLVTVALQYDSGKLQYVPNSFQTNVDAFPGIVEGPVVNSGFVGVTVSIGSDPTKAITVPVKLGTVSFTALDGTGGVPTSVLYEARTSALSIGPNDSATENVVSTTEPVFISVSGASNNPTATPPVPTDIAQVTSTPTDIPQPTNGATPPSGTTPGATSKPPKPTADPKPTSSSQPSKFKQKILRLLEKRLEKYLARFEKLKDRKKIAASQIRHLEKDVQAAIDRIRRVISSVNQSNRDKDVKKQVKSSLKDLLADYKELSKKLDKFADGMDSVARNKQKSGKDTKKAQANLKKMKEHLKNVETLSAKTDEGVDTLSTDAQLKLAIKAVEQNAKMIKSELAKANAEMKAAETQIKEAE